MGTSVVWMALLLAGLTSPAMAVDLSPFYSVDLERKEIDTAVHLLHKPTPQQDDTVNDELWRIPEVVRADLDDLFKSMVEARTESQRENITHEDHRKLVADQQRFIHSAAHLLTDHVRTVLELPSNVHDLVYKHFDTVLLNHSSTKRNRDTKAFIAAATPCVKKLLEQAAEWGDKTDEHRIPVSPHKTESYHRATRRARFFK